MTTKTIYKFAKNSKFYSEENEASFKIPVKKVIELTNKFNRSGGGRLQVITIQHIDQMWINEDSTGYMRNRIRTTGDHTYQFTSRRTLDTKFELVTTFKEGIEKHERYEFNSDLTNEQYWTIAEHYVKTADKKFIEKTRVTVRDIETSLIYTIDIYLDRDPDIDMASVEIEFEKPEDLLEFKKPDWAREN